MKKVCFLCHLTAYWSFFKQRWLILYLWVYIPFLFKWLESCQLFLFPFVGLSCQLLASLSHKHYFTSPLQYSSLPFTPCNAGQHCPSANTVAVSINKNSINVLLEHGEQCVSQISYVMKATDLAEFVKWTKCIAMTESKSGYLCWRCFFNAQMQTIGKQF